MAGNGAVEAEPLPPSSGQEQPAHTEAPQASPQVARLRRESGGYRNQRNQALKENAALRTVLSRHGIDPTDALDRADMSGLTINGGEVVGEVPYTLPKPVPATAGGSRRPSGASEQVVKGPLTRDDIMKMDRKEIRGRFDEVMGVLRKNSRTARF